MPTKLIPETSTWKNKAQGTTHGISFPYFMVFLWYFPCIISLAVSTSIIHLRTRLEFWSPNQGTFNSTFNRQPQVCFFQISDLVEDRVRVPWRVWEGNPIGLPRKLWNHPESESQWLIRKTKVRCLNIVAFSLVYIYFVHLDSNSLNMNVMGTYTTAYGFYKLETSLGTVTFSTSCSESRLVLLQTVPKPAPQVKAVSWRASVGTSFLSWQSAHHSNRYGKLWMICPFWGSLCEPSTSLVVVRWTGRWPQRFVYRCCGYHFFWEKIGKNTTMAQNTTLFCRFLEILKVVEVQNEEMSWNQLADVKRKDAIDARIDAITVSVRPWNHPKPLAEDLCGQRWTRWAFFSTDASVWRISESTGGPMPNVEVEAGFRTSSGSWLVMMSSWNDFDRRRVVPCGTPKPQRLIMLIMLIMSCSNHQPAKKYGNQWLIIILPRCPPFLPGQG